MAGRAPIKKVCHHSARFLLFWGVGRAIPSTRDVMATGGLFARLPISLIASSPRPAATPGRPPTKSAAAAAATPGRHLRLSWTSHVKCLSSAFSQLRRLAHDRTSALPEKCFALAQLEAPAPCAFLSMERPLTTRKSDGRQRVTTEVESQKQRSTSGSCKKRGTTRVVQTLTSCSKVSPNCLPQQVAIRREVGATSTVNVGIPNQRGNPHLPNREVSNPKSWVRYPHNESIFDLYTCTKHETEPRVN